MPKSAVPCRPVIAGHADAIRTVPLHVAADAGTPTVDASKVVKAVAPNLTYRNGPLLTNVEVFTIVWGAAWRLTANAGLLGQVNQFFDVVLSSPLIDHSPVIDNSTQARKYQPFPPYNLPNLPSTLKAAGHTWRNYAEPLTSYFNHIGGLVNDPWSVPSAQFDVDAKAGTLPDVSWLYAPDGFSEHPGDFAHTGKPIVGPGMRWTADRVIAAATGPLWSKTAILITWDDWGGWYDHVVPPQASTWAGGGHAGYQDSQFRYGPRVPCLAVSPFARQGLDHTFLSHASIVKFCIRLFGLKPWGVPALLPTDRTGDMWSLFDFNAPPRLNVPTLTPV